MIEMIYQYETPHYGWLSGFKADGYVHPAVYKLDDICRLERKWRDYHIWHRRWSVMRYYPATAGGRQ